MSPPGWTTVIGLEVHVQLATRTKLFCRCESRFGAPPNTLVCPVCLGLPGALPVPSRRALELAVRAGLALGAAIAPRTRFDRKNYFYPDLPKGYQISQYDRPIAAGGRVELPGSGEVALERIHLEEDAGKSTHRPGAPTLVDLNRCGVPLLEVVTRPGIRSPAEAHAFLDALKQMMRWTGVSECDMEKGSLRCDANISLAPAGSAALGTKVEIKNLNSFRMVQRALEHEEERQAALLAAGERIVQETRLWDDDAGETRTMRSKEEAHDYRYFPDPDLPPLAVAPELVDRIRAELPELPVPRQRRFQEELGLSAYDAAVLTAERETADFFEAAARACGDPKAAANWVQGELLRFLKERDRSLAQVRITPDSLAGLIALVAADRTTSQGAKAVFARLAEAGGEPAAVLDELGLSRLDDPGELARIVAEVLAANPKPAADFRAGKETALKALIGQVMRATRGRAEPRLTEELLRRRLTEER